MKTALQFLKNPFTGIAGGKALGFGAAGIAVASVSAIFIPLHYHGLLHYGPAPNPAWWCFFAEHLIIWLVPALIFYLSGLLLSRSRIRLIDVLGTTAFAQLPFVIMNLFYFPESVRQTMSLSNEQVLDMIQNPDMLSPLLGSLGWLIPSLLFFAWTILWMVQALRVSCNLKGWRLAVGSLAGILVGDMICRLLIGLLY